MFLHCHFHSPTSASCFYYLNHINILSYLISLLRFRLLFLLLLSLLGLQRANSKGLPLTYFFIRVRDSAIHATCNMQNRSA